MAFRNETILTFSLRNMITIVVMVTIGWFILHLASVGVDAIISQLGAQAAGDINDGGAEAEIGVTY